MVLYVCVAAAVGAQTLTPTGPYLAVTDRNTYPKPPLPALGPAGTIIIDPVFQSPITRITDNATRPGFQNYSFRTPSSPHQNAWSAHGTYFYVLSDDGTAIPFRFDAGTGRATRISPTTSGNGGMVLLTYVEPQFSYVDDSIIYVGYSGTATNDRTIDQYDFTTGVYTPLVNLDDLVPGLSGTYIGGIGSSAGPVERVMTFFGGTSQDHHHYVLVFDRANPSNRLLLDTWASTINGQPASATLNFSLHHAAIDRSGRYVMLYTSAADQSGARQAPQSFVWDTQTGSLFAMVPSVRPYGHDALGYGVTVNQDCCTASSWDAVQWQLRSLATPAVTRDMLPAVLSPKEIYLADHTSWNNASASALVPYISATYRYGNNTTAWRALDDEIIAVETDRPGENPTIWRFAHHRSDIRNDLNATAESFWYEPRPNVSDDGHWVLFTSNWEKTLGTDPHGDSGTSARQDVFLVQLRTNSGATTPTVIASDPLDPPVSTGCTTADPFASIGGGICVNGGWVPAGSTNTSAGATSFGSTVTLTSTSSSGSCATPDPFASIGGGTCVNGGWIPGTTSTTSTASAPVSSSVQTVSAATTNVGCSIPDPFVAIGGGTCINGGWIPGHVTTVSSAPSTPTSSPAPSASGCTIPDPFVSIGGGVCVNGGWRPRG